MKTSAEIRVRTCAGLAVAIIAMSCVWAAAQARSSRADAKRSGTAAVQSQIPRKQTIPDPKPLQAREGPEPEPARAEPEAQIVRDTRAYELALRDLAAKAEEIVKAMPEDPAQLSKDFHDLRGILVDARTNLLALLGRRKEIEAQAETVLKSAAAVRQSFVDLGKRIDESTEQLRRQTTDKPQAVESAARAMQGIKEACVRGDAAVAPLRDLVMQTHREAESIFVELEAYPQIFSYAIETAELYEKGLGEPASYISVVQGLYRARENLRVIISTFIEAASKAEQAIKKIPPSTGSIAPVS